MTERLELKQLYVHTSIGNVIPEEAFVETLDDIPIPTALVGDSKTYGEGDAVITYTSRPEFLDAAWVHCARAGYDEFDTSAYEKRGVPLTNSTGIHGATVGEMVVGFMLSFARLLHVYRDHQNDCEWHTPDYERPFTIEEERVCVVGLGTIGAGTAQRADALGADVVGVRRSDDPVKGVSRLYDPTERETAIADARFVVVATPHTPATEGLIGTKELDAMREDAYLINVARGQIVDQDALIVALEDGKIAGAALDVFEEEPLLEDSPLWDLENVIIAPHKGSATNRYHLDIADLVKENVQRYRNGESLKNRVA
ncbi:D-2-hydroxyacid dehydrogenase [Halocatena marina]|uniref:D-2-hydroxyacid dehydrogenase n=1 Tax=Halocatena marina TaxID=2934937 RepID=UPI0024140422|nr:D-2-hydroxyacid dehydrogenase [Halocatena marina]